MKKQQEKYQYNYTYIEPLAMVDKVPKGQNFSLWWLVLAIVQVLKLGINYIIARICNGDEKEEIKADIERLFIESARQAEGRNERKEKRKETGYTIGIKLFGYVLDLLPDRKNDNFFLNLAGKALLIFKQKISDRTDINLEKYEKLFVSPFLKLPAIANNFQEDETFAYMRVAGPNPVVIERMTEPNPRFPVTEEQYKQVMGSDDSLEVALGEGRVYIADYAILAEAIDGTFPQYQKYLYAPLAMFAVPKGTGDNRTLKPVAIQCQQEPGPDNPVVTPKSNPYSWMFAKTVVQVADGNYHEAVTHLARTHLFIEPFVIATHRQLPDKHPVSLLLRPHFKGTLAINNAAQARLIAPGGPVNKLLAATIDSSLAFAVKGVQTYPFNKQMLRAQLERRGVLDAKNLPVYPYRDDALRIWDAIHQWVSSYLNICYNSDLEVQGDTELQAWVADLTSFNGGRVIDFGDRKGSIQTLDYLIEAATLIIFTSSAQHAAVNFPQKSIMSYAPAMPLAGYVPASSVKNGTEEDFLNLLPPVTQAKWQLLVTYLLGSVYYTQLGKYGLLHFRKLGVQTPLREFQEKLREIETEIEQRNAAASYLPYAYEYLLPSKIPQSINI
ncbi:MAG: lipoxygenase [Oscillatoria sp. SIO1A7]|nr:lipoxygenase [Oscillatoria sp. SIO1A7]